MNTALNGCYKVIISSTFSLPLGVSHKDSMNNCQVVAISGVSGSGKTSIVKKLADEFNCPFLLFDDHTDKSTYPQNMKLWLNNGADVSLIKTPRFIDSLQDLVSTNASGYVFIEEPFGKSRKEISSLIDYVVLLDQPLELCLARIIKRHTDPLNVSSLDSIDHYLNRYLDHFREIYLTTANQVRNHCDLAISDVVSAKETTHCISRWLKQMQDYNVK
jgi:uridine kinase